MACATAPGRGALAVVRFSGPDLEAVFQWVRPSNPGPWRPGRTRRVNLWDGEPFDDGVAVWTPAPHTYTGEATLEVTLHGNPLLVERLLGAVVAGGVRLAGPGEFTRRAAMNGKLDLLAAEAVDQVVRATTPAGLAIARAGLAGQLTETVQGFRARVIHVTAELEARLDYPGDELALEKDATLEAELRAISNETTALADSHRVGRLLVDGARVALVGPVNAGKSSLFNALVGSERALVHDQPGTTRDVVEVRCRMGPLEVTLLDTAGERETNDPVEAAGLALAEKLTAEADLLVVVRRHGDAAEDLVLSRTADRPRVIVHNGLDERADSTGHALATCALDGRGIPALKEAIVQALVGVERSSSAVASLRQATLLREVGVAALEAEEALGVAGVAVAADRLVGALESLDALTGADTREEVLDALFSRFCIGK